MEKEETCPVSRIIPALSDNYMFLLVDEKTKVRFF
jgi:hypothetical protein